MLRPLTLSFLLFSGLASFTLAQTTAPSSDELMQPKTQMAGYGAETARLVNQRDEIVSVLRNGAVVIAKRVPSPVVAMRGYCETGGIYEGRWLGGGLSHLLEHLVAGGSSDRRTEAENKNLLQLIGNDSNAYTTEDHTCYFVNTTTAHLEQAVDLVTGWMLGAKITPAEYRREYQVVQRELERGKGQPANTFWDLYVTNRFRVSPARVPVIGYQEVIQGLSRDDVYSYYLQAYQPNNMVFSVVGDIDPEVMLAAVRKYVSDAKPGRAFSHDIAPEPPVLAPRTLVATFPRLGQAQVDLSFPSVSLDSADLYALDLLATVMGGSESSPLVQELRDNQQVVSSVECSDWTPSYAAGSFEIEYHADPAKIDAATKGVLAIAREILEHGVDDAALASAKTQMRMSRLRGMQTSQEIAASLALDYIGTGDPHFSDSYVDKIEKVTAAMVQDAARRYLDPSKLITTVLMPAEAVGSEGLPKAVDLIRPGGPTTAPSETATVAEAQVQKYTLSNGTILLTKRFTTTPLVAVRMYATGGVTDESADTNGLGNVTMSMLRRGTTSRDAKSIAEFFDSIGGEIAAVSGNNTFAWSMQCAKGDLSKAMEVYADLVLHPAFADNELAEMKQRIEAQIAGQDADWHNQAFRFFKSKFYGPIKSPYQFMPIGTKENVNKFTSQQLKDWYQNKVLTAPRVLAIYGNIDAEEARAMAEKLLGGGDKLPEIAPVSQTAATAPPIADATPSIIVDRVEVQKTEQSLAGVVIGFNSGATIGGPNEYAGIRAFTLAGGYSYPTGYIFETLRGLGLSYEAAVYDTPGRSAALPGGTIAYAGCDGKKVNQATDLMLLNMARLQGSAADIQQDWFDRGKDLITTNYALERETPMAQAESTALDELFGLGYRYHEQFDKRINGVTIQDVRNYAQSQLRHCIVTISTPNPELVTVTAGTRTYSEFPPVDLTPKGIQLDTGTPH